MMGKTEQITREKMLNDLGTENEKFNEIKNLKKQLEEAKELAEERLNHLKYLQADFDNYRKRFDKEKEDIIKLANENLIQELIVILDDFDNSIKLMENEKDKEGILRLYRKLFHMLEKHGLKHIEALGKKLNPEIHEALIKESNEKEDGIIIEEIQRGYMLSSKVIRPSKVKISENKKVQEPEHLNIKNENNSTSMNNKDLKTGKINE